MAMIQKKRDGLRWDGMKRKGSKIEISEDGTTAIRQEGGGDFLGQHFAVATSWGIDVGEKFSWIIQFNEQVDSAQGHKCAIFSSSFNNFDQIPMGRRPRERALFSGEGLCFEFEVERVSRSIICVSVTIDGKEDFVRKPVEVGGNGFLYPGVYLRPGQSATISQDSVSLKPAKR